MTMRPGVCDVCGRPTNTDGDWLCAEHPAEPVVFGTMDAADEVTTDGDAGTAGE